MPHRLPVRGLRDGPTGITPRGALVGAKDDALVPYIAPQARALIDKGIRPPENVGELTYVLYREAVRFLPAGGGGFADRAAVIAALECAKTEFARQHLSRYEDMKRVVNGDVT